MEAKRYALEQPCGLPANARSGDEAMTNARFIRPFDSGVHTFSENPGIVNRPKTGGMRDRTVIFPAG